MDRFLFESMTNSINSRENEVNFYEFFSMHFIVAIASVQINKLLN